MIRENLLRFRVVQFVNDPGGVVVRVVVKVTGDVKPGFVRNRALPADIEPANAGDQAVEPVLVLLLGRVLSITPKPQRKMTDL